MLFIVSPPRSGSSVLAQLVESAGYIPDIKSLNIEAVNKLSPSEFNPTGYNEDVPFTLFNDQLIKKLYGVKYSFLHSPPACLVEKALNKDLLESDPSTYTYDLDESSVSIPCKYESRLQELAQHDWDVWGLTRMKPGAKWYKSYSRHGLSKDSEIISKLRFFRNYLTAPNHPKNSYLKDPRIIFAFPAYMNALQESNCKVLVITRNYPDLLRSMRLHYGHRMFTANTIDAFSYVSNHFNYAVEPQPFEEYIESISYCIKIIKRNCKNVLHLSYDRLMNASERDHEIKRLNYFLSSRINPSILREPNHHNHNSVV
jgi:hypothetical protein